jgi:hypothetical protein
MLKLFSRQTTRWGWFTSPNGQAERFANCNIAKPNRRQRQPKYGVHKCETSLMVRETGKQPTIKGEDIPEEKKGGIETVAALKDVTIGRVRDKVLVTRGKMPSGVIEAIIDATTGFPKLRTKS